MKCANYQNEDYKTLRQWARLGYLPYSNILGTPMWCNKYCQNKYLYFLPSEVYKATDEEIQYFWDCLSDIKKYNRSRRYYPILSDTVDWLDIRLFFQIKKE